MLVAGPHWLLSAAEASGLRKPGTQRRNNRNTFPGLPAVQLEHPRRTSRSDKAALFAAWNVTAIDVETREQPAKCNR